MVGSNRNDHESDRIFASACIVNNQITKSSNYRSEKEFNRWLIGK